MKKIYFGKIDQIDTFLAILAKKKEKEQEGKLESEMKVRILLPNV